ncbi:hypothetical protein [Desulfovibrio sp. ZJ369]|uniref:hypothetical protein n=1 Tax=Desulfovibrio sp. ZJ369 TaxID=2709793 RepID=UPI0013EA6B81|nr:hypothetical protein [Desulfovibrio sp. ZJ369]
MSSRNLPELVLDAPHTVHWPDWAEDARLDDDLAAQAYEATPPACRAALKSGLALAHMHFGQSPGSLRQERRDNHLGFWRHTAVFPAPWAVIAFTPAYAAAARLAAACVPALLAGVPLVAAVCVGGCPSREALVSLELTGVEDIFTLEAAALRALLEEESQHGPGRLVLLHNGDLDDTSRLARTMGLPCYEERCPPTLLLPNPEAFDPDVLAFAQGEALQQAPQARHPARPAAWYCNEKAARAHCNDSPHDPFSFAGPLALAPGCEGFWLHDGLTPDFFTVTRLAFGPLERFS